MESKVNENLVENATSSRSTSYKQDTWVKMPCEVTLRIGCEVLGASLRPKHRNGAPKPKGGPDLRPTTLDLFTQR